MHRVDGAFPVELPAGRRACAVRVDADADLPRAVEELGLGGRAVLVVVGGASKMSGGERRRLGSALWQALRPHQ